MKKRKAILISGVTLVALLLVGVFGVIPALAQDPPPTGDDVDADVAFPFAGPHGLRGDGLLNGDWTMFDKMAEALGLTPDELFDRSHDAGMTLEEIAEEEGVEMEDLRDALMADRMEAMREAIEQAVEDGRISEERADWMLEGIEQGFGPMGMGRGFGHMGGRGGRRAPFGSGERAPDMDR